MTTFTQSVLALNLSLLDKMESLTINIQFLLARFFLRMFNHIRIQ